MLNNTRMIYFNKLFLLMTFKSLSKDFYCFNEDSYNVENFYHKNWENFGDQIDDEIFVIVGVLI